MTNDSTNEERRCTKTHGIEKELSICQSLLLSRHGEFSCVESHEAAGSTPGSALPSMPGSFSLATKLSLDHTKNFRFSKDAERVVKLTTPLRKSPACHVVENDDEGQGDFAGTRRLVRTTQNPEVGCPQVRRQENAQRSDSWKQCDQEKASTE